MERFKDNWDDTKARFMQWWNHEKMERPMLRFACRRDEPLPGAAETLEYVSPEDKYTNWEKRVANYRSFVRTHAFLAESFPNENVVWGLPLMAMYYGGKPEYLPYTVWLERFVDDWNDFPSFRFDPENPVFRKHLEILKKAKELSEGEFFINIPDIMERLDVLASVRGSVEFTFDLVDEPERIHRYLGELDDAYEKCYDSMYEIVKTGSGECAMLVFQLWAPGKMAKLQCDYSALMNPSGFDEFMLPGLKKQCDFLEYSMYHLDGKEAVVHLDSLLTLDKLDAIQWTPGDGQPDGGCEKWYPIYRKVREKNKSLWISFSDGALRDGVAAADRIVRELGGPDGLYFHFRYGDLDEQTGRELIRHAETNWK